MHSRQSSSWGEGARVKLEVTDAYKQSSSYFLWLLPRPICSSSRNRKHILHSLHCTIVAVEAKENFRVKLEVIDGYKGQASLDRWPHEAIFRTPTSPILIAQWWCDVQRRCLHLWGPNFSRKDSTPHPWLPNDDVICYLLVQRPCLLSWGSNFSRRDQLPNAATVTGGLTFFPDLIFKESIERMCLSHFTKAIFQQCHQAAGSHFMSSG